MKANSVLEVRSRRLSTRFCSASTSRTSQCSRWEATKRSCSSTRAGSPWVRSTTVPTSRWFIRRRSRASSSSRKARTTQASLPCSSSCAGEDGAAASGAFTVSSATRSWGFSFTVTKRWSSMGPSGIPRSAFGRSLLAASALARSATTCSNLLLGTAWSTRRHSTARLPFTPSATVEKKSARSRRTLRLSTTRVRPPVPGRTPRSGTSGRETAELPSSMRRISSQASASS